MSNCRQLRTFMPDCYITRALYNKPRISLLRSIHYRQVKKYLIALIHLHEKLILDWKYPYTIKYYFRQSYHLKQHASCWNLILNYCSDNATFYWAKHSTGRSLLNVLQTMGKRISQSFNSVDTDVDFRSPFHTCPSLIHLVAFLFACPARFRTKACALEARRRFGTAAKCQLFPLEVSRNYSKSLRRQTFFSKYPRIKLESVLQR